MATVRWTEEAKTWLGEIYEYIAADNPRAAQEVVDGIVERVEALREWPLLGYRYPDRSDRHYRILWYGHYRIAYLVVSDDTVDIVGIYHQALNIRRFLSRGH